MLLKKLLILIFMTGFFCVLNAQKKEPEIFKALHARSVGPAGMSGRVTALDVVSSDPEVMYAGSASGGLWKSTSGGTSWFPVFDEQPILSIGAVAVCQRTPDIVWAGTGEGNPRNSHNSGAGIYKSIDGGRTWKCMGLENTRTIHRILLHRDNPDIVYVAAMGSIWGPNAERGVFKTTDGGKTWNKMLFVNDRTGCADLITDPSNPDKLIAGMWEYQRYPWFFESGGPGSGMYVTHDGGLTWTKRTHTSGLPEGKTGRMGLAICRSRPNVIYALIEASTTALYRSDDGGVSWNKRADSNIGNRPFYYAEIHCDPLNENRLYNLYSEISVSNDGGKTFEMLLSAWRGHPDHHAFWIHPENPDFLIEGNDGGMHISRDKGKTWTVVENLPAGQFYHVRYDTLIPYHLYGGLQDNGSWYGPAYNYSWGGLRNSDWQEIMYGDGFDVLPQPPLFQTGFAMYQGGNLHRFDKRNLGTQLIQPVHPGGVYLRFNWNAPLDGDPFDAGTLYFGSQFVHKSTDGGQSWEIISPDLTSNDTALQKQSRSGGLTIDATRAENYTTLTTISASRAERGVLWAGSDDGYLHITRDGGKTWNSVAGKLPGFPKGAYIQQVSASAIRPGEALVSVNDYRRDNWEPYLYHTTDYGQSWKRIAGKDEVKGHVWCAVQDTREARLFFCGTDQGLWYSTDAGNTWKKWKAEFPSVPVSDLAVHPTEHDLIIATFGRALWVIDDISPLRQLCQKENIWTETPFKVFPPPAAFLVSMHTPAGARFLSDAGFSGENRPTGARVRFWIREPVKPDAKDKSPHAGKLLIHILSRSGDTLRTFAEDPDTFLFQWNWDLRAAGARTPSYSEQKTGREHDPSGYPVVPGEYKLVAKYHEWKDSVTITVKPDPLVPFDATGTERREKTVKELYAVQYASWKAFERLKEADKIIGQTEDWTSAVAKEDRDLIVQKGKTLRDSIKVLMGLFLTPKDFKGYDHVTVRISQLMSLAEEHLSGGTGAPTATAEKAVEQARLAVSRALARVNHLFTVSWQEYRDKVNASGASYFKAWEEIQMDR